MPGPGLVQGRWQAELRRWIVQSWRGSIRSPAFAFDDGGGSLSAGLELLPLREDGGPSTRRNIAGPQVIPFKRWALTVAAIELFGCALAAHVGTPPADQSSPWPLVSAWLAPAVFVGLWVAQAGRSDLYSRSTLLSGVWVNLRRGLMACANVLGLLLLLAVIGGASDVLSRRWFLNWTACVLATIAATRLFGVFVFGRALSRGACVERAMVLAPTDGAAALLAEMLRQESDGRISIPLSMAISDRPEAITSIEHAIRDNRFERIVISGVEQVPETVRVLMERLALVAVDVTIIPSLGHPGGLANRADRIGSLSAINVISRPLTTTQEVLKRCEDLVLTSLALVFLTPLMALIAIGIKLDSPGPVFFRQPREGYNGRVFELLKFRTMFPDKADQAAARQTSRNDPRVTKFGEILRRMSLDELPQLINVLRGEMSVVGPRPHALGMTALGKQLRDLMGTYGARHRLRPGITGLAQVRNCRGEINTEEKLRRRVLLDCEYIECWSLALDFLIILKTVWLVINDGDAY